MIINLFSIFDPRGLWSIRINWVIIIFRALLIFILKYASRGRYKLIMDFVIVRVWEEIKILFPLHKKGRGILFSSIFVLILIRNLFGLLPYIFTSTAHLRITLRLALPLWVSYYLTGWFINRTNILAHLVPQGTPPSLISFIVLIERVRRIIRPFTLAVRLAANIIAGHLLLTLLGGSARIFRFSRRIIVVNSQVLLVVLEVAVAAIQSYVFVILRSLYLRET